MLPVALLMVSARIAPVAAKHDAHPFGVDARPAAKAYLRMPSHADGKFPELLSATGAFQDTRKLKLAKTLLPYDIAVAFWSDGASKSRAVAVAPGKIKFAATGEWAFPKGTVFVKTFELSVDETHPAIKRRLETRLLVLDEGGGVYGAVYKWRADNSDADLLSTSLIEEIPVKMASGEIRKQPWYYPSRKDCLTCHTATAGGVLGVKTRQMNRDFTYPSGVTDNQLRAWNHIKLFEPGFDEAQLPTFAQLAPADDATRTLEDRARSYLDANCAQCHRPGGTVANFDARYDTPLAQQALIDGAILINHGIDRARVISPHDVWRSIAFMRMNTVGEVKMPPVARETIDRNGVALLGEWINSLPGQAVLDPPVISPAGGSYDAPIEVSLQASEPGADIRYTLDGSVPGTGDLRYQQAIKLTGPTVLRARAFKDGFTRSITAQEVFVVDK